jgi:hypothetical protein
MGGFPVDYTEVHPQISQVSQIERAGADRNAAGCDGGEARKTRDGSRLPGFSSVTLAASPRRRPYSSADAMA